MVVASYISNSSALYVVVVNISGTVKLRLSLNMHFEISQKLTVYRTIHMDEIIARHLEFLLMLHHNRRVLALTTSSEKWNWKIIMLLSCSKWIRELIVMDALVEKFT